MLQMQREKKNKVALIQIIVPHIEAETYVHRISKTTIFEVVPMTKDQMLVQGNKIPTIMVVILEKSFKKLGFLALRFSGLLQQLSEDNKQYYFYCMGGGGSDIFYFTFGPPYLQLV